MSIGRVTMRAPLVVACLLLFSNVPLAAADWPTYRHDSQRSGITAEEVALPLTPSWAFRASRRVQPAWPGPAKVDYYTTSQIPMKPRMAYDRAIAVTVVGGSVYFGSSVDHAVTSLDARTGNEEWSFVTDAPVRMAPYATVDRIYVGSDDGSVYCLSTASGALRWKYTAAGANNRYVANDGNFVSAWPIRSGVALYGSTVYFSAGFLPGEGVYVCAVDASTGSDQGVGRWKHRRVNDVALQGYVLASSTRLYFPSGRSSPYMFDRSSGNLQGQFAPSGSGARGTFALLAGNSFIAGPAGRDGARLDEFSATSTNDSLATYPGGNSMVVTDGKVYILTDNELIAARRSDLGVQWRKSVRYPYALILAGGTLFAGGEDAVAAFDSITGEQVWTGAVDGNVYDLAFADARLYVSTDRGVIQTFVDETSIRPGQRPGDANQDGRTDISDAIRTLRYLFGGAVGPLPCAGGSLQSGGNLTLLDVNGDATVNVADPVYLLSYLFQFGPAPGLGEGCVPVEGCAEVCR